MKNKFYSQYMQDRFIYNTFFRDNNDGFYLDIGANDGVSYSNTLFFENIGWNGICVEPISEVYNKLKSNRSCVCINCGISNKNEKAQFLRVKGHSEMLSGLLSNYTKEQMNTLDLDSSLYNNEVEIIEVNCLKLNDLLNKYDVKTVDFCSIDTEGSELEILESIDFNLINILTFSIENQNNDNKIRNLLLTKGYSLITSLGGDEIYAKNAIVKNIPYFKRMVLVANHHANTQIRKIKKNTRQMLIKLKIKV